MLIFLVVIILLTFNSIYDKNSFVLIEENIKNIDIKYIIICFIILILYFLLQGIYMKSILETLKKKITLKKGVFYSVVEFYFSGITPSSTGGQPVQLYYMTKDKIPVRKSYITLMLNTVYFKLIVLIMGVVALIFKSDLIFKSRGVYIFFFMLGLIVDSLIILLCLILTFKQKLIKNILVKIKKFGLKFKLMSKKMESMDVDEITKRYKDEIKFISAHKWVVFVNFVITFVQRILLFSIAYVIYRALGFNNYSYFDLLLVQIIAQVSIESFPLPGGAGLSEGILHNMFTMLYASKLADVGMLLTRTFSFYIPLVISGLIILVYNITNKKKNSV